DRNGPGPSRTLRRQPRATRTAGSGGRVPPGEPAHPLRPVTAAATADAAPARLERTRRQGVPHGGRHRAPILRQPVSQVALRDRYPARPYVPQWPATQVSGPDLV